MLSIHGWESVLDVRVDFQFCLRVADDILAYSPHSRVVKDERRRHLDDVRAVRVER